jgi:hypothetical protein
MERAMAFWRSAAGHVGYDPAYISIGFRLSPSFRLIYYWNA